MKATPEMIEAMNECRDGLHLGGFLYGNRHVIRDHAEERKRGKAVVLWEMTTEDYNEGHDAMEAELRRIESERVLNAALAAMPGEPVAWGAWSGFEHRVIATTTDKMKADTYDGQGDIDIVPLYLAPPPPADKAEIERLREDVRIAQGNTDAAINDYNDALGKIERLREALAHLERAGTDVSNAGATPGSHFPRLTSALIRARAALKGGDA